MKNEITKEDYYDHMYDIEQLTDLNRKRQPSTDPLVIELEQLVKK